MNSCFEELGIATAKLAMIKRRVKLANEAIKLTGNYNTIFFAQSSEPYLSVIAECKALQSRKTKALNKCKKIIKKEEVK